MRRLLAALFLLLVAASPALADQPDPSDQEKNKQFVALCGGCLTVIPLVLVPLGLAFHLLLRALAPRRTRLLLLQADGGRARTFALGLANALVLAVIGTAAQHLHAALVGLVVTLAFWGLAFVGSHGLAASLGGRITGNPNPEVKELALGWFVLVYVGCFPIVGWMAAAYWTCRAIGTAVLGILTAPERVSG